MKKFFPIIFGIVILAALIVLIITKQNSSVLTQNTQTNESLPISATITTPNNKKIHVRIADTDHERQLGLSYFPELPSEQGMLFLFDKSGIYPFWMKGMNFPLDIIWLKKVSNDSFEVVYVAENVDPTTYPATINPEREADAVLETNAQQAKGFSIKERSIVKLDIKI